MRLAAVVLAYYHLGGTGEGEPVFAALAPIRGKPMLDWVVDALHDSGNVESITVVGPPVLDGLLSMRHVERRVAAPLVSLGSFVDVLRPASADATAPDLAYLLVPCDAVFVTPELVASLAGLLETAPAPVVVPVTTPAAAGRFGIEPVPATTLDSRIVVPGSLAFVREPRFLPAALRRLEELSAGVLRDSGMVLSVATTLEAGGATSDERLYGFVDDGSGATAIRVTDGRGLRKANELLASPYTPPFRSAKIIANARSGGGGRHAPAWLSRLFGVRGRRLDREAPVQRNVEKVASILRELGVECDTVFTQSAAESTDAARRCAIEGCQMVIASGGDGTVNAVVNGLAGSETVMGTIPLGTVNLFAVQAGIPLELRAACQVIAEGKVCRIDLGRGQGKFFSCIAGIGFDAFVISRAGPRLKKALGGIAYVLTGIWYYLRYQFRSIWLVVDGQQVRRRGNLVLIMNGGQYSSGFTIVPEARMDDGLLDVVIFKSAGVFSALGYLWGLHKGTVARSPAVEHLRAARISVQRHGRHYIQFDGEHVGATPIDIEVVPSALRAICGA